MEIVEILNKYLNIPSDAEHFVFDISEDDEFVIVEGHSEFPNEHLERVEIGQFHTESGGVETLGLQLNSETSILSWKIVDGKIK